MSSNYYASDAKGKDVINAHGKTLGQVDDMVISPDGQVEFIILSYDGIFGTTFNDKLAALPYVQCGWDEAKQAITIQLSKEQLEATPTFNKDDVPSSSSDYYTRVHSHYGNMADAA